MHLCKELEKNPLTERKRRWSDRAYLADKERGLTSNSANLQKKKKNRIDLYHTLAWTHTHMHTNQVLFPRHACADRTPALTFICAHAPAHTHCYFHDSRVNVFQHQTSVFLPRCDHMVFLNMFSQLNDKVGCLSVQSLMSHMSV